MGDVEGTTKDDSDKEVTYTNFKCYNFTKQNAGEPTSNTQGEPQPAVDEGVDDDRLPF